MYLASLWMTLHHLSPCIWGWLLINEFLRPCMLWALGPWHLCVKSYPHQVPADIYHTRVRQLCYTTQHNTEHKTKKKSFPKQEVTSLPDGMQSSICQACDWRYIEIQDKYRIYLVQIQEIKSYFCLNTGFRVQNERSELWALQVFSTI